MINNIIVNRYVGEKFAVSHLIEPMIIDSFFTDINRKLWPGPAAYRSTVMSITESTNRVEGYLMESNRLLGLCFMTRSVDIHYGLVATPVIYIVKSDLRGNRTVGREFLKLVKAVVAETGCSQYMTVTHLDNKTQVHKLRSL